MSKKKRTKNKTYPRRTETRFKQPILVPDTRGLVVHIDGWDVALKDKYEWPNQMIKRCDKLAGADLEKNLPVVEGIDENIPLQGEPLFFEVQIPSPKNTTT